MARRLVAVAVSGTEDDTSILTDTGWFPIEASRVPSGEDLAALQKSVGDTGALDPPKYWDAVRDPGVAQRHEIRPDSEEYQKVVKSFQLTLRKPTFNKQAMVLRVERIQNLAMWQSYVVKRQTICYRETQQTSETSVSDDIVHQRALERFERSWLWHATNYEVIDKILQQGFNRSFCGKNATVYGKGVYFARDAAYSAYPMYAVPDSSGTQYMMACRVVVGEYCRGMANALTPDVRDAKNNILHDSTVGLLTGDSMASPSIYVTYHDAQAYPEVR